jgi:hypothetical protein
MSTPEKEGMDSKELAKLVDFGAERIRSSSGVTPGSLFDSRLVLRSSPGYYLPRAFGA